MTQQQQVDNQQQIQQTQQEEFTIVVAGVVGVGKTNLVTTFVNASKPSRNNSYSKSLVVDQNECNLQVMVTSGSDNSPLLRSQLFRIGDGFLLVFDKNKRASLEAIPQLYNEILETYNVEKVPMILVGNTSCEDSITQEPQQAHMLVTDEDVDQYSKTMNVRYIEVNTENGDNIDHCFEELIREIRTQKSSA